MHSLSLHRATMSDTHPEYCLPPAESSDPAVESIAGMRGIYGACSAETYRAAGSLHAAHRDAGGFLDGIDRFSTPEFWRRDDAVRSWIYRSEGQDAPHGPRMDDVHVFYHSGHGGMEEGGQYRVPMGAMRNGTDTGILSGDMRLGGDRLRYLFWSASESLRLREGHVPTRTWAGSNAGLRMMFGFDSVCWDSARQGEGFWRHWGLGKSFSQSWLDAAADVSADQVPSVCAIGDTREEVVQRLFAERRFTPVRAATRWWAWRWTQSLVQHRRDPLTGIPGEQPRRLRLRHPDDDLGLVQAILAKAGADPDISRLRAGGEIRLGPQGPRLARMAGGGLLLEFAPARRGGRASVPLHRRTLIGRARAALRQHGFLVPSVDLSFDRIMVSMSAGLSLGGRAEVLPEAVDELTIQFRQCYAGMPVVSPDGGWVRVVMGSDCRLLRIETRLRSLASEGSEGEAQRPMTHSDAATAEDKPDVQHLLARQSAQLLRDLAARGAAPLTLGILPGLTEIGYGIRSNTARLIARQGVEVTCVRGFRKRYWIQSDLAD